jgi:hypothetical protein
VTETSPPPGSRTDADLVGAFLTASRVLVAMAARSLTVATEEITVPQHRALVLLAVRGPQRTIDLADLLGVNSSTATRHCDWLQRRACASRACCKLRLVGPVHWDGLDTDEPFDSPRQAHPPIRTRAFYLPNGDQRHRRRRPCRRQGSQCIT